MGERLQNTARDLFFRLVAEGRLTQLQSLVNNKRFSQKERKELINNIDDDGWTVRYLAELGNESILRSYAAELKKKAAREDDESETDDEDDDDDESEDDDDEERDSQAEEDERFCFQLDDWTALHMAAYFGREDVIRWLLSDSGGRAVGFKGALAKTMAGETALHIAARQGHLNCVQALLQGCKKGERKEMLNSTDEDKSTVLHAAAYDGQDAVIRWLLSDSGGRAAGFKSVLALDADEWNALRLAAHRCHLSSVIALLEGSKIENGEREKLLRYLPEILSVAVERGHGSIIKWLLSESGGQAAGFIVSLEHLSDELHHAAQWGYFSGMVALVEGCKVEEREELINAVVGDDEDEDGDGLTILHVAAQSNDHNAVKWILSDSGGRAAGFKSVLAKDPGPVTTLYYAVLSSDLEMFLAVVEGCKVENGEREEMLNAVSLGDSTVLHAAASASREDIIRWLLSDSGGRAAGFKSILAKDDSGSAAIDHVRGDNSLACLLALVEGCKVENGEREAMINAISAAGRRSAHWKHFDIPMFQWLLSDAGGRAAGLKSSTITATPKNGESVLHYAADSESSDLLNTILSGCTTGERLTLFLSIEEHGWSVLHRAARGGSADNIRELLLHHPETKTIVNHRDHRGMTALHRAVLNGGQDEESRREWHGFTRVSEEKRMEAIEALLTFTEIDDDADEDPQAARLDVNLGLKIE